jgi:DNA mismatch repair ATPase MutS
MKAFLMFENTDFALQDKLPWNDQALTQDLELKTLCNAMASGDDFLFKQAIKAVLIGTFNDLNTIIYRQDILKDCLTNPSIVSDVYKIAIEAYESKNKQWFFSSNYPSSVLYSSISSLQTLIIILKKLRKIADEDAGKFESKGFTRFFEMLKTELNDEYFAEFENHLLELEFHDGVLLSAGLGKGNKGINYVLHRIRNKKKGWIQQFFSKKQPGYTFSIHPRDEGGVRALSDLRNEGINQVANAVAQSNDHIRSFFEMLRTEMAFYMACLNLHGQLTQMEEPVSFPVPLEAGQRTQSFSGLYDVCLALTMKQKIVGNDVDAENKNLMMITGANQGGKSTLLRSIGLSQLMMQCGMFVPAESFTANICDLLVTHYKREEDIGMKSGKLDEELSRMNVIIDHLTPNSVLLFNESFAATNDREGSEIASQIVSALLEKNIKVVFVTHLFEFAHRFFMRNLDKAIFLRAERKDDGTRTFKLTKGQPLQTSFGVDLFNKIFVH